MFRIFRTAIRNHFSFSRSQTNGMMVLLPLTFLFLFMPGLYYQYVDYQDIELDEEALQQWQAELASMEALTKEPILDDERPLMSIEEPNRKPFFFDPNTISLQGLQMLGFHSRVAQTLINFRNSGGTFDEKQDLRKIYGVDDSLFNRLEPFIVLPQKLTRVAVNAPKESKPDAIKPVEQPVDMNLATAEHFQAIYGIGEVLSDRIIKFREKLGGFVALTQFDEVYGLDSAVKSELNNRFYLDSAFIPRKLDANRADYLELRSHPYISSRVSNAIVNYRNQHGQYLSLEELKEIKIISDSIYQKILPYLQLGTDADVVEQAN